MGNHVFYTVVVDGAVIDSHESADDNDAAGPRGGHRLGRRARRKRRPGRGLSPRGDRRDRRAGTDARAYGGGPAERLRGVQLHGTFRAIGRWAAGAGRRDRTSAGAVPPGGSHTKCTDVACKCTVHPVHLGTPVPSGAPPACVSAGVHLHETFRALGRYGRLHDERLDALLAAAEAVEAERLHRDRHRPGRRSARRGARRWRATAGSRGRRIPCRRTGRPRRSRRRSRCGRVSCRSSPTTGSGSAARRSPAGGAARGRRCPRARPRGRRTRCPGPSRCV